MFLPKGPKNQKVPKSKKFFLTNTDYSEPKYEYYNKVRNGKIKNLLHMKNILTARKKPLVVWVDTTNSLSIISGQ